MAEHLFGQRQIGRHQEGRPVNRVEADNILADNVDIGGPEAREIAAFVWIANAGHIGGERIDPDIHHVAGRVGHGHTPIKAGARNTQILEAAFHKAQHFVAAAFGANEVGIVPVKRQQRLLIFGEAEKPCFLRRPLNGRALRRELRAPFPFGQLTFIVKGLVADGIPAFITIQIKVAGVCHGIPDGDAGLLMIRLSGATKTIIRDVQSFAHLFEIR